MINFELSKDVSVSYCHQVKQSKPYRHQEAHSQIQILREIDEADECQIFPP